MRVCFMTTSYPRHEGDMAGHFVQSLARQLVNDGLAEVTVLCPAEDGRAGVEMDGDLRVHRLSYFWPRRCQKLAYGSGIPWNLRRSWVAWVNIPFFLAVFFWQLCRLRRWAQIVHAHWGVLGAVAVLARPIHRCPIVLRIHGTDLRRKAGPIRWLTLWAIKKADIVLTLSEDFRQMCCRVRSQEEILIILHGVDAPSEDDAEKTRHRLRSPGDGIHIISVGRLIEERRHDLLVRALVAARERFGDVRLTLVGDGPQREALVALAKELGLAEAVTMTGMVPTSEVSKWLLSSDLYVSPTTVESFGLGVVEAAAHGLPIVTTRVGYAAELVDGSGGGIVVPPGDGDALTEAIVEIAGDQRRCREMGKRVRQRVAELGLTWASCARRTDAVYRELLSKQRRVSQ